MKVTMKLPPLGEEVAQATVVEWHSQPGDLLDEGGMLVTVALDKVDVDVPAPLSGVLEAILVPIDMEVGVGEPLCVIATAEARSTQ